MLLQRYDCEHKNNCSGEWEQANQVSFLAGNVALSLSPRQQTNEATPTTSTPTSGDYRQKYSHLIGGLECAEKTAVKMEPNRNFGYGKIPI